MKRKQLHFEIHLYFATHFAPRTAYVVVTDTKQHLSLSSIRVESTFDEL